MKTVKREMVKMTSVLRAGKSLFVMMMMSRVSHVASMVKAMRFSCLMISVCSVVETVWAQRVLTKNSGQIMSAWCCLPIYYADRTLGTTYRYWRRTS